MKKLYTLIAAVAVVASASAQTKVNGAAAGHPYSGAVAKHLLPAETRAIGDTLMWMPSPGVYLANAADYTTFAIGNEDNDGLTPNNAGETMMWGLYYSTDNTMYGSSTAQSNYYHPWENPILSGGTDSTFFWHATSWFSPAGQADNWFSFGPITLPAGATLSWTDRTNPAYRDGYKVYMASSIGGTTPSFTDFTGAPLYTKTDSYPSVTYTTDTTWVMRSVGVPASMAAMPLYVAFQHTANDMDVLYLDEFLVVESASGVEEFTNGAHLFQNSPNPASSFTNIEYQLEKNSTVVLNVYDVTGKMVSTRNMGEQSAGKYGVPYSTADLTGGVYFYSLVVNGVPTTSMKMVVVK